MGLESEAVSVWASAAQSCNDPAICAQMTQTQVLRGSYAAVHTRNHTHVRFDSVVNNTAGCSNRGKQQAVHPALSDGGFATQPCIGTGAEQPTNTASASLPNHSMSFTMLRASLIGGM